MIAMVHHAISELLAKADIHIGGKRPWDIRLQTPGVIEHAIAKGNLGFGEVWQWVLSKEGVRGSYVRPEVKSRPAIVPLNTVGERWSPLAREPLELSACTLGVSPNHAIRCVIVDQTHGLHEGVSRSRANKFPALPFELF